MNRDSGLALITTLLILSFLSLIGAALLSTASVDVRIAENYRANVRLRYLAEGAVEEARELLRLSGEPLANALARASGPDLRIETSDVLGTLLLSDDRPILPADPSLRASGEVEAVNLGRAVATWHVFMRNDIVDGPELASDTNGVVTLVGIARSGERRYRAEADIMRRTPPVVAALMVNGVPGTTGLGGAPAFRIDGTDRCGRQAQHAIGLVSDDAVASVLGEIPAALQTRYPGAASIPDVFNVSGLFPGVLRTVSGLERLVGTMRGIATDVFERSGPTPFRIGRIGSIADPRVVIVEGDAVLESGSGFGILVVRGTARVAEGFVWNGLVLVVGEGALDWNAGATVYGAVLVARTLDQPPGTPSSPLPQSPGEVRVDFTGAAGGIYYDSCVLEQAFRLLPVSPIAVRGY